MTPEDYEKWERDLWCYGQAWSRDDKYISVSEAYRVLRIVPWWRRVWYWLRNQFGTNSMRGSGE